MMIQGVSVGEMLNQSVTVLTKPSVESFERFERHGGMREAMIYVGTAAALAGGAGAVFGLLTGGIIGLISGLVLGVVPPLAEYFAFSFLLFFMGKNQGGTGTQDEAFYTTSLYTAPILAVTGVVGAIPILNCLLYPVRLALGLYQLYLGYLAARSSMNLDQNKAIITAIVAIIGAWVAASIVFFIFGVIGISAAVVSDGLRP